MLQLERVKIELKANKKTKQTMSMKIMTHRRDDKSYMVFLINKQF